MQIDSKTAARMCNVGPSGFCHLTGLCRFNSIGRRKNTAGAPSKLWSGVQVSCLLALPVLLRRGVSERVALDWAERLSESMSDEVMEAAIADGRKWLMLVGSGMCRDLLPRESAEHAVRQRAKQLAGLGIVPELLDFGQLWNDVAAHARQLQTSSTE